MRVICLVGGSQIDTLEEKWQMNAVEDEYFRVMIQDDGSLWYSQIVYDEG